MCQPLPRLAGQALAWADGPRLNVPRLEVREMHSVLQQPVSHQGHLPMAHSFPQAGHPCPFSPCPCLLGSGAQLCRQPGLRQGWSCTYTQRENLRTVSEALACFSAASQNNDAYPVLGGHCDLGTTVKALSWPLIQELNITCVKFCFKTRLDGMSHLRTICCHFRSELRLLRT